MRCRNCNLFKVLHSEECHTCAVERADKAEAQAQKALEYAEKYLALGDEGLMNEMKDAMMMEDES